MEQSQDSTSQYLKGNRLLMVHRRGCLYVRESYSSTERGGIG